MNQAMGRRNFRHRPLPLAPWLWSVSARKLLAACWTAGSGTRYRRYDQYLFLNDFGFPSSFAEWAKGIRPKRWMGRAFQSNPVRAWLGGENADVFGVST